VSEHDADRRERPRPVPIAPALRLKLDVLVQPLTAGLQQPYRGLVLLGLLIVVSIGWVFWCIEVRMVPVHSHVDRVHEEVELREEIDHLGRLLNTDAQVVLEQQVTEATARITPNYRALADWLHTWAEHARAAGLRFHYTFDGDATSGDLSGTMRVPVAIEIKINVQSAANDGYYRLLRYLHVIETDPWLKELRAGEMEAENGQVRIMRLRYDVWMIEDPDDFRDHAQPGSGDDPMDNVMDMAKVQ